MRLLALIQGLMGKVMLDPQTRFFGHFDKGFRWRKKDRSVLVYKNWAALCSDQEFAAHPQKTSYAPLSE